MSDVPTQTGSYVISLADETLALDAPSIPMFTPKEMYQTLNFGEGTRVRIIARTTRVGENIGLIPLAIQPVKGMTIEKGVLEKVSEVEEE